MDGAFVRGYVVFERVAAAARHAARQDSLAQGDLGSARAEPEIEEVRETPWPLADRVRDAWADTRELWAQTTFFVLDPNSWG
jgi:hypothetical protein